MTMRRYYVDTSVFGGCLDADWIEPSSRFLDFARSGRIVVVTSAIVDIELRRAPKAVQAIAAGLPTKAVERAEMSEEAVQLRDAYLSAGVLGRRSENDAMHVALASIARVDAIVSWNFRDLVRDDRIKGFNLVNLSAGYGLIIDRVPSGSAVR
jgi:predicted nucleic acid-binding protein